MQKAPRYVMLKSDFTSLVMTHGVVNYPKASSANLPSDGNQLDKHNCFALNFDDQV